MAYNTGSTLVNFIPEIWSAEFLEALRADLVFGGPGITNHNYEGEISQKGDTVHITTVGDPTVRDYVEHTDITTEQIADSGQTLTIDQAKYFSFELDDIEDAQVLNGGSVMAEAAKNAAYVLSETADSWISTQMAAGIPAANQVAAQNLFTAGAAANTIAYDSVVRPLKLALDKAKAPKTGRWLVASPDLEAQLLLDNRFVNAEKAADQGAALREGFIGRALGFDIYQTTAVPATAATSSAGATDTIIAGHPNAYTFANAIAKVESTRMEKRFADMMKGLHFYGGKLLRPTLLASCVITTSAAAA